MPRSQTRETSETVWMVITSGEHSLASTTYVTANQLRSPNFRLRDKGQIRIILMPDSDPSNPSGHGDHAIGHGTEIALAVAPHEVAQETDFREPGIGEEAGHFTPSV